MANWEIQLIIRGYYRRNVLQYQLQRIQAWAAMFCMSGNKNNHSPQDVIPLYCDKYISDDERVEPLSAEEVAELQAEMAAYNETFKNQEK